MTMDQMGQLILKLWDDGLHLLAALAVASLAAFAIMATGPALHWGPAASLFDAYGPHALIATVGFGALALARAYAGRPSKSVHIIPDEDQSFWAQPRQSDGHITTQFSLRLKISSLVDRPVVLSQLQLVKPHIGPQVDLLATHVITRHPAQNVYGFDNPVLPGSQTRASCSIIVDGAIGTPPAKISAVLKVSDDRGVWHSVTFQRLRCANPA